MATANTNTAADNEGLTAEELEERRNPSPQPEPISFKNYNKKDYIRFNLYNGTLVYGVINDEASDTPDGGKLYPIIFYTGDSIIATGLKEKIVISQHIGPTLLTSLNYTHNDPYDTSFREIYNTTRLPATEIHGVIQVDIPEDIFTELIEAYNLANNIGETPVHSRSTTDSTGSTGSTGSRDNSNYSVGGKKYRKRKNKTKRRNKKTKRRRNRKTKKR
jgi:hypothetical protein